MFIECKGSEIFLHWKVSQTCFCYSADPDVMFHLDISVDSRLNAWRPVCVYWSALSSLLGKITSLWHKDTQAVHVCLSFRERHTSLCLTGMQNLQYAFNSLHATLSFILKLDVTCHMSWYNFRSQNALLLNKWTKHNSMNSRKETVQPQMFLFIYTTQQCEHRVSWQNSKNVRQFF